MRLIDTKWIKDVIRFSDIAGDATDDILKIIDFGATEGLPTTGRPDVLWKTIEVHGERNQIDVAIEEMSELTKALIKNRRADRSVRYQEQWDAIHGKNGVVEETADVIIMLMQLCMIFDDTEEVQHVVIEKVNRLEQNLAGEKEKECCGNCRHHENRVCDNDMADDYGDWTECTWYCDKWEKRE